MLGANLHRFEHPHGTSSGQLRALRAVASVEFIKGLVVLLAGFGVLSLVHRDAWDVAESFLEWLHISPETHYAQVFLNLADQVTDAKLWAVAVGALAYSTLRFFEAYGLWTERAWAEWLALSGSSSPVGRRLRRLSLPDTATGIVFGFLDRSAVADALRDDTPPIAPHDGPRDFPGVARAFALSLCPRRAP